MNRTERQTGYRQPSPQPGALVDWPSSFGVRAILTIDVEEEFDWSRPLSRDAHGISTLAALPPAQARLVELGLQPAFFCSYPVVNAARGAAIVRELREAPGASVGAQLHAWVTPPFDEPLTSANSFAGNLAPSTEAAKLDVLTDAITAAAGARPRAYRAGRYGIGPNTLRLLAERGYRLDSSMRARHDYRAEGGPDFRAIGNDAFRAGAMLCVPLTTVFTGTGRAAGSALYDGLARLPLGRTMAARSGVLSRVALTPEGMPFADAAEAVRVAVGGGTRLLNFAFHSPTLVAGHTPYTQSAKDLARFWRWWDAMSVLLARLGVEAIGLDALIDAADQASSSRRSTASTT